MDTDGVFSVWNGQRALKVPRTFRTVRHCLEQLDQVHGLANALQVISVGSHTALSVRAAAVGGWWMVRYRVLGARS